MVRSLSTAERLMAMRRGEASYLLIAALACTAAGCLPIGRSIEVSQGYVHAQAFGDRLRAGAGKPRPAGRSAGASPRETPHPRRSLIPAAPGALGFAARAMLLPSGSRGATVGLEVAGPLAECGYTGGGALGQVLLGWSLLPLPDESPLGAEILALAGGSFFADETCQNGFFLGGRVGMPLRISPSIPAFALDRDHGAPTAPVFYLVPQVDLVRYTPAEPDAAARTAVAFSAMLGLRVLFWSPMEP